MVARVLAVAAIAAIALAGTASAQYTFCEYYTGALNPTVTNANTNATLQLALVSQVVGRAALGGGATGGTAGSPVGLFNDPLNQGFFNGTLPPRINYPTQTTLLNALVLHLNQFFGAALGCRSYAAANPWDPTPRGTMRSLHAAMNINNAIQTSFINQVAGSLASFGVVLGEATSRTSELAYAVALFSQFNRYTLTTDANNFQICSQDGCPEAQQIYQFHLNDDGSITRLGGGSNTLTVNNGDYINFRFASTNGLTRTSSGTNTTAIAVSGGTNAVTYTVQVSTGASTNGVYYWYNNAGLGTATSASATSRVQVTVNPAASSSSGSSVTASTASTGSSAATGTGNGAGATASLGFAAVAAVVAAAFVVA